MLHYNHKAIYKRRVPVCVCVCVRGRERERESVCMLLCIKVTQDLT